MGWAAHWYSSWQQDHAAEAQNIAWTDLSEGTAAYFESVAVARAAVGFEAPLEQYRDALLDSVRSYDLPERFVSADGESYGLGVIAGLLADQRRPDWKEAVRTGKPILQSVLTEVKPVATTASAEERTALEQVIKPRNAFMAGKLGPFLERWQANDSLLLSLPFSIVGSFSLSGFFTNEAVPGYTLFAGVTATLRLSGGEVRLQEVTLANGSNTPCGSNRVVIPLRPDEVRLDGNRAVVNMPGLNSSVQVRAVQEAGRTLLCGS